MKEDAREIVRTNDRADGQRFYLSISEVASAAVDQVLADWDGNESCLVRSTTSKKGASKTSKILKRKGASAAEKMVAGSDLLQAKKGSSKKK